MTAVSKCGLTGAFLVLLIASAEAQQSTLKAGLVAPPGGTTFSDKVQGVVTATIMVPADTAGNVPLTAGINLVSAVGDCRTNPASCDGSENFVAEDPITFEKTYGCADEVDNDSDGLLDSADTDCQGVQGWSMSVAIDDCFVISGATTRGTVGDLDLRPPGIRDSEGGNFEQTETVDPANNGGQGGVVSAVVLSFTNPVILFQDSDELVLRILGQIDHGALAGGSTTDGCLIRVVDPADAGLQGSGEPVKTAVTVSGETDVPATCALSVRLRGEGEPPGIEPGETAYRATLAVPAGTAESPEPPLEEGNLKNVRWTADVDVGSGDVSAEAMIMLESRLDACASNPANCDGAENFVVEDPITLEKTYGCIDEIDNDADGKVDSDDEDCIGVQGWSLSVITDPCFNVSAATTRGTVGDLELRPPGLRDSEGGNFEQTEVVNPADNGGREGVVSAVVLSFTNPVILKQDSTEPALRVIGSIDASSITAPGEETAPCGIAMSDPNDPLTNLRGSGEPVKTAITVAGASLPPDRCQALFVLRGREGQVEEPEFRRGDANDDGRTNIADAPWIINGLFQSGPPNPCDKAADANDDGINDSSDAVYIINYLFVRGPTPPPPFGACGTDPTDDSLTCNATMNCP